MKLLYKQTVYYSVCHTINIVLFLLSFSPDFNIYMAKRGKNFNHNGMNSSYVSYKFPWPQELDMKIYHMKFEFSQRSWALVNWKRLHSEAWDSYKVKSWKNVNDAIVLIILDEVSQNETWQGILLIAWKWVYSQEGLMKSYTILEFS